MEEELIYLCFDGTSGVVLLTQAVQVFKYHLVTWQVETALRHNIVHVVWVI